MPAESKIEWTDATWNPVTGCSKVSAGCQHCYAESVAKRFWKDRKFTEVQMHQERLSWPLQWRNPKKIFVNSMSDLFHDDVPESFIQDVFRSMAMAEHHTFQILTKRPERMSYILRKWEADGLVLRHGFGIILPNIWLGVSVEDQDTANARLPILAHTPARHRFVSAEPLLGPVNFSAVPFVSNIMTRLEWVICGGESGHGCRPMRLDWVRDILRECERNSVHFFMKQLGGERYKYNALEDLPEDLRIREIPSNG